MKKDRSFKLWSMRFVPLIIAIVLLSFNGTPWAQQASSKKKDAVSTAAPAEDTSELARAEKEMKSRLEALTRLRNRHKALADSIKKQQAELMQLEAAGTPEAIQKAEERLRAEEDKLLSVFQDLEASKKLYDKALERYQDLSKGEKAEYTSGGPSAEEEAKTPMVDAFERKKSSDQAALDARLADDRASTLQAELDLLFERKLILGGEIDTVSDQLRKKKLSQAKRNEMKNRLKQLDGELANVEEQISGISQRLILAEATFRIKSKQAKLEAEEFARWHKKMFRSVMILLTIVLFLMLIRSIVRRRVKDPQRRYMISRNISILAFFVAVVGLMIIFIDDLSVLVTSLGVAAAGLAIALREIVASFFAWFVIRGAKGYQVGDWVQTGNQYGEVIDIGFLATILSQVTPLEPGGDKGGSWTGGMVYFPNSAIFNETIVNYTRGYPYIWARLIFTVTYESNWKQAEKLLFDAVKNKEILDTAKKARTELDKMASQFAIKLENTQPTVRTLAADSGIELRLRFLVHPRRRRILMDRINRQVMEAVDKAPDVDFAYNTLRVIPTPLAQETGSGEDDQ